MGIKPPQTPVKLSKIEQKKKEFEDAQKEAQVEIERMTMQQEDEYSLKVEMFQHKQKFV